MPDLPISDFKDTNAVVTGASSGIGRAIAIALAKSGTRRLLIHYCQNEDGALQTAKAVSECGATVVLKAADLGEPDSAAQLCEYAFAELDTVDTWVNNAGADVLTGSARDLDFDAKLQRLLNVDVLGTIRLSRLVSARLVDQVANSGKAPASMTFTGWDQAPLGMEGDAGQMFGPVKSAVMAYSASLAQTLAPLVRVNTIAPGWIQTKWGESTNEYWDRRARSQSLMGRWGRPEDIARAVVYACDPGNTFLTGQVINLNGGWNRKPDY